MNSKSEIRGPLNTIEFVKSEVWVGVGILSAKAGAIRVGALRATHARTQYRSPR